MAFLGKTYSTADMPTANNYEPLPDGWYSASVKSCDINTTKAGDGQYLKLAYTVTGPTHQGRVVFGNINLENPNTKAVEIGLRDFNSLLSACGLSNISDSDALIGHNIEIKLTTKTQPGYEPTNEIRGYRSSKGSAMPTAPAAAVSAPVSTGGAKAPWQK